MEDQSCGGLRATRTWRSAVPSSRETISCDLPGRCESFHDRASGGRLAPPEVAGPGGPPVRIGPGGRFGGGLGSSLSYTLAIVGAALAILTRLDLGALFVRGSAPRGGLSTYVGWDGQVIAPIQAGG